MDAAYTQQQHGGAPSGGAGGATGGGGRGGEDDMHGMWQYLDSTLSTPNGVPPTPTGSAPPPPMRPTPTGGGGFGGGGPSGGAGMMPAALTEGDTAPLTEDDNGMYNELGDVFNMFFNLDTDDAHGGHHGGGGGAPHGGAEPLSARVALSRHASAGSSSFGGGDGISPGLGAGYPSMSPATMLWLQSLGKSPSSESLSGLISPAGLFSASGGGSAGGVSGGDAGPGGGGGGGLPRSPSMELIDWKAYNDAVGMADKTQKDPASKWRVIPQHGPHADGGQPPPQRSGAPLPPPPNASLPSGEDAPRGLFTRQLHHIKSTVVSIVGALSATDAAAQQSQQSQQSQHQHYQSTTGIPPTPTPTPPPPPPPQVTGVVLPTEVQQQYALAVQRLADEKNKRKAIISPEYVQYSSSGTTAPTPLPDPIKFEVLETGHYAAPVPDATGRRPSKKSLHQADTQDEETLLARVKEEEPAVGALGPGSVRCKCTGKCRNARCACVKAGFVCGDQCKCVGCANPFVPMAKEGIAIHTVVEDVCLMQFLSKVKSMAELLESRVAYECCGSGDGSVQVKHTVETGFACPQCHAHFTYSWCTNRLCHDQKKPRNHCAKCRRCGDHRNAHCDTCNHCYFAGVANSFRCSCKGSTVGTSGSSGVMARSVVATGETVSTNPLGSKDLGDLGGQGRGDQDRRGDATIINPSTSSAATSSSTTTMAAGLSSSEADKDDACPVQ